jgi:hypothetical protein
MNKRDSRVILFLIIIQTQVQWAKGADLIPQSQLSLLNQWAKLMRIKKLLLWTVSLQESSTKVAHWTLSFSCPSSLKIEQVKAGWLKGLIVPEKHAPLESSIPYTWFYSSRAAPQYSLTNFWSNQSCYTENFFRGMKFRRCRVHPHISTPIEGRFYPTAYPSLPFLSCIGSPQRLK